MDGKLFTKDSAAANYVQAASVGICEFAVGNQTQFLFKPDKYTFIDMLVQGSGGQLSTNQLFTMLTQENANHEYLANNLFALAAIRASQRYEVMPLAAQWMEPAIQAQLSGLGGTVDARIALSNQMSRTMASSLFGLSAADVADTEVRNRAIARAAEGVINVDPSFGPRFNNQFKTKDARQTRLMLIASSAYGNADEIFVSWTYGSLENAVLQQNEELLKRAKRFMMEMEFEAKLKTALDPLGATYLDELLRSPVYNKLNRRITEVIQGNVTKKDLGIQIGTLDGLANDAGMNEDEVLELFDSALSALSEQARGINPIFALDATSAAVAFRLAIETSPIERSPAAATEKPVGASPYRDGPKTLSSPAKDSPTTTPQRSVPESAPGVPPTGNLATRFPVPDAAAQQKSLQQLKEMLKSDFTRAKETADQVALARKLGELAMETRDDPNLRYVMATQGLEISIRCCEPNLASDFIGGLNTYYVIDAWDLRAKTLVQLSRTAKTSDTKASIAKTAIDLVDSALAEDRCDVAVSLASTGSNLAGQLKDVNLRNQAQSASERVKRARKERSEAPRQEESNVPPTSSTLPSLQTPIHPGINAA